MAQTKLKKSVYSLMTLCGTVALTAVFSSSAQAQSKTSPDVLVFTNGDQLTGTFTESVGDNVTFHTDMAGDVIVPWSKIKELHTSKTVAVIPAKNINKKTLGADVVQGTLNYQDNALKLSSSSGAALEPIDPKNTTAVVDAATFNNEILHDPGITKGWTGAASFGTTLVQASQNNTSFNGAVALVRQIPVVSYLPTRNRSMIDFSGTYGKLTQRNTADIKTAIYHADAEHDWYLSNRFYVLVTVSFDHNYSQLLDLQQIYGGGVGYTLIKRATQQLDLKATMQYEKQAFMPDTTVTPVTPASASLDLVGSSFGANYWYKFPKGITYTQSVSYIPSYNDMHAYSASEVNQLSFPAYKNLSFVVGTLDTYLNSAPSGSKRNSFQFTTGVSYAIK